MKNSALKNVGPQHRVLTPNEWDSATEGRCALAIMTKAPRAGQVKTRLTPPLTPEEAAAINICFLRDTATAIAQAGHDAQEIACYTPTGAEKAYRDILPRNFHLIAQRSGSLEKRLVQVTQDLFSVGFGSVCLIASDSPTAPASVFAEAASVLAQPDDVVVLGPSRDGGYYLIGLKEPRPEMFAGIDWSSDRVFKQTIDRAVGLKLPVHLLPPGYDVDDQAGLSQLCHELLGPDEMANPGRAPATRQFLLDLIAREGRERIWPEPGLCHPSP
ncbi:MAG: TIGR04282 family arsenosugar biosynthesis glycosyltransferase [Chthoniobacterales bacterium]